MFKVQIEFLVSWFFFVTARYLCRLCTKSDGNCICVIWPSLMLLYSSRIWILEFKSWREKRVRYMLREVFLIFPQWRNDDFLFGSDSVCGVCIQNTNHVTSWHLHLELFSSSKWNSEVCRYICQIFFKTAIRNAINRFFCVFLKWIILWNYFR